MIDSCGSVRNKGWCRHVCMQWAPWASYSAQGCFWGSSAECTLPSTRKEAQCPEGMRLPARAARNRVLPCPPHTRCHPEEDPAWSCRMYLLYQAPQPSTHQMLQDKRSNHKCLKRMPRCMSQGLRAMEHSLFRFGI